jgi:predicted dehydrogenase
MNIIFFGLGSIGKRHFRNLLSISRDFNYYAYRVRNNPLPDDFEKITIIDDLRKIKSLKIDLAIISSPPSVQDDIVNFVVKNSIHFFVEKPVGVDYVKLHDLLKLVQQKKIISMVGFNLRFHPIHGEIKEIIKDNCLGNIVSVRSMVGQYLPDWHPDEDYSKGYSANSHLGGGVLLDLIHEIDFVYSLFGEFLDYKSFFGKFSSLDSDSEDIAEIIIKFKSSVIGSIRLDYIQHFPQRSGQIIGENATLFYDLIKCKIEIYDKNGLILSKKFDHFDRNEMYLTQMELLIESINNKVFIENDFESGLKVLKLVNDLKNSNL